MKERKQRMDLAANNRNTNFIIKALAQFYIQVGGETRESELPDLGLLRKSSTGNCLVKGNANDCRPLIWMPDDDEDACDWSARHRHSRRNSVDNLTDETSSVYSDNSNSNSLTHSTSNSAFNSLSNSRNNSEEIFNANYVVNHLQNESMIEKLRHQSERNPFMKRWRKLSKKKSKEDTHPFEISVTNTSQMSEIFERMSMQQQLALTALNLTAPACSSVLKKHRNWVQLSGHPGSLAPAGLGTIWKKQPGDTNEAVVYESLMKDCAKEIVPKFFKEFHHEDEKFIEISDLLYGFNNPCVMDIKMGTRTFLESEVSNAKSRNDLYLKMISVDPNAPTEQERKDEALTKLRYMDFRDTMSSSRSLGFRIDALKMSNSSSVTEMKKVCSQEEVIETLTSFLQRRDSTKKQIIQRLKVIKENFENSLFFKDHEVIGSSILIVYDESHAGAWIIDFAKTCSLPEGTKINHRDPWIFGNHEEGFLFGLEYVIETFEAVPVNKSRKIKFFRRS